MSFQIDDKVYSLRLKEAGLVIEHDGKSLYNPEYPVFIKFKVGIITFTEDGRYKLSDKIADIYHGMPEIIAPPEPKRRPKLEKGDRIMVRACNSDYWKRRIFKEWRNNNNVRCFIEGCDEWTSDGISALWGQWKLPEDKS